MGVHNTDDYKHSDAAQCQRIYEKSHYSASLSRRVHEHPEYVLGGVAKQ